MRICWVRQEFASMRQSLFPNHSNGERFLIYAMPGKCGSGVIVLNGPEARKVAIGDQVNLHLWILCL